MKQCPSCSRTFSDDTLVYCLEDGSALGNAYDPGATQIMPPARVTSPPPTAFAYNPPPSQSPPGRRRGLAIAATAFGSFSSVLMVLLVRRNDGFRYDDSAIFNIIGRDLGIMFIVGSLATMLAVLFGTLALFRTIRKPTVYRGRAFAIIAPGISALLTILVIGLFAVRRLQGPPPSYASTLQSNSSTASRSSSDSASMSEVEKYRLFYAAARTDDKSLEVRAAKKIGILDDSGNPSSDYQSFINGAKAWAVNDTEFIVTVNTPEKARAYVLAHL